MFGLLDWLILGAYIVGTTIVGHHLKGRQHKTLTETVRHWRDYGADKIIPLPHPSPRNNIWLKKNPWFEAEVLPHLRSSVRKQLG